MEATGGRGRAQGSIVVEATVRNGVPRLESRGWRPLCGDYGLLKETEGAAGRLTSAEMPNRVAARGHGVP